MFRLIRIPLLLALILATAPLLPRYAREVLRIDPVAALGPWLLLVAIAAVFLVVVMVGRDHRHAGWILTLEAVISLVLVLVPPILWFVLFGRGVLANAMGATTGNTFVQALAVAWLVVVIRTMRLQRKRDRDERRIIEKDA